MKNYKCPCGCGVNVSENIETIVKYLETKLGTELEVTSGARCKKHNEKIGGAPQSAHMLGLAVDLHVDNSSLRYRILRELFNLNIKRIGIGFKKKLIHFDISERSQHSQEVIWGYGD